MIAKIEIYGIILAVALLAATGAYFYAKHQGVMEERGRWEVKTAAATKADLASLTEAVNKGAQIAKDTFEQVQKGKAGRVIDRGVIEREIKTDVRYVTDCFPDSGRLQWNGINAGRPLVPAIAASPQLDAGVSAGVGAAGLGLKGGHAAPKP